MRKERVPRLLIGAAASGCGKTTIVCGLLAAWKKQGKELKAWKCGPDYIDPMFHKKVLGIDGGNLDSFFFDENQIRRQLGEPGRNCDLSLIEGVMGYYDGMGGNSTWASTYEVAAMTHTPSVLIIDGKGASLSLAAVIRGFLQYKKDSQICGVILNRTGKVMAERLRPVIEAEGIKLFGAVPDCPDMSLESRHLGLKVPWEAEHLNEKLERAARILEENVDLEGLYEAACQAPELTWEEGAAQRAGGAAALSMTGQHVSDHPVSDHPASDHPVRIAVARDEAFSFYYQENMELLKACGARLIPFSPLRDEALPEGVDGLILGGGYPETYGQELSENESMRVSIKKALSEGLPLLAECGGFLYLHEELEDEDGTFWSMVGVIGGKAYRTKRLSRFGYICLIPEQEDPCLKGEIKGHEFHYWESEDCGRDWRASKPTGARNWQASKPTGARNWQCVHSKGYQIAGFPHLYYPSNPGFLRNWLDGCRKYGKEKEV